MSRAYNVIDADGHILEPLDLWDKYMDPKFRDGAPHLVKGEDGKDRLVIEERTVGDSRRGFGGIGGIGARQGVVASDTMKYQEGRPGGFDPHQRIPDMDADGIDAAFLYPSIGLFTGSIQDPELAAATCRAYNRGWGRLAGARRPSHLAASPRPRAHRLSGRSDCRGNTRHQRARGEPPRWHPACLGMRRPWPLLDLPHSGTRRDPQHRSPC